MAIVPFKKIKKFFKNPLTNRFKCGIIYMSRGERGLLPMAEKENEKNDF